MADVTGLADRIDAEFAAVEEKIKTFQVEQVKQYQERQKRLEQLTRVFEGLRDVWRPRLEVLATKLGGRVKATPRIVPSTREVTFDVQSSLARVRLKFSATTDRDIQKVILSYDLEIIPVLMRFQPHAELEIPLQDIDKEAVGKWFDDRIVDFVQTYLSLGEDAAYLRPHMVEDPVAHVRFPKFAAHTSLQWQGQTFYFISEDTFSAFTSQNRVEVH